MPRHTVTAETQMYRAHNTARDAWWFDSSRNGRFNLPAPAGTCYTATKVETAVREKVRDAVSESNVISRVLADSFRVSTMAAPIDYKCAAVSADRAVRFGIVRELVTMEDYTIPQEWAETIRTNSFEGIYYASAYTTGGPTALALFGTAGAPGPRFTETHHLSGADACEASGMIVAGPPTLKSLTII